MQEAALLLCEIGLPKNIPGFSLRHPAGSLPFWGNYYFIDFMYANFSELQGLFKIIIAPDHQHETIDYLAKRWEISDVLFIPEEDEIDFFMLWLKELPLDLLIFSTTSFVSIFKGEDLISLIETIPYDIVKVSIDHIPVDLFVASKKKIISLLEKNRSKLTGSAHFLSTFFKQVLYTSFESIEDVSGKVLFHYNLMQYFEENIKYIDYSCTEEFLKEMHRFNKIEESLKQAYIGPSGNVINSFMAHGVEVHGSVENSILFPNVTIMKGARIINSVILSNNKIGSKTFIENAFILPYIKSNSSIQYNIEDNCHIGEVSSSVKNLKYPEQVYNGITTLGMNVRIPKGCTIAPGCFIDADIPLNKVKQHTKLNKGESIVNS
ncbi:MAG: hypothetical protein JW822_10325 [Spirochaetales bacterium]|nr:hypothetical protein [Spirochaetales bacterium]